MTSEGPHYRKWSEIRPERTSGGEPPDPYEEELVEGFGQDSVSKEVPVDPFGSDEEHAAFLEDLRRSRREQT